jgi:anti-anti-sigma factor
MAESSDSLSVLVVDEEPLILVFLARILDRNGMRALLARNPRKALEIAQRRHVPIDLILTDWVLKDVDKKNATVSELKGPELVTQLREIRPALPVLYMSAQLDSDGIRICLMNGRFEDEEKFDTGSLIGSIRQASTAPALIEEALVCQKTPIEREGVIAKYLSRTLDSNGVEEFEGHYLGCDECFDELRVSEGLAAELRASNLIRRQTGDVSVLQFKANVELTHSARELAELRRQVFEQGDSRVIIDLRRVTRIDSTGLGQLMSCYSHLVKNRGALRVLNPTPEVEKLLKMTGISTLIPAYHDEQEAVSSFHS